MVFMEVFRPKKWQLKPINISLTRGYSYHSFRGIQIYRSDLSCASFACIFFFIMQKSPLFPEVYTVQLAGFSRQRLDFQIKKVLFSKLKRKKSETVSCVKFIPLLCIETCYKHHNSTCGGGGYFLSANPSRIERNICEYCSNFQAQAKTVAAI